MLGNFLRFKFSIRNYYLLMSIFVAPVLFFTWNTDSFKSLIILTSFAIIGVLGETFINFWWQTFFGQRLWIYNTETVYHKYTSLLNFLPWGVGGYIYLITYRQVTPSLDFSNFFFLFIVVVPVLIIVQKLIFDLFKPYPHFKYHSVGFMNLLFFYFPIILVMGIAVALYGWDIFILFVSFGIISTSVEYLFGKACQSVISKKLWIYTYLSFDHGHFTPIAIILFAFGGFYFLLFAQLFGLL